MTEEIGRSIGPGSGLGTSIVIARDQATLPAQNVRLVRPAGAGARSGDGTASAQSVVEVVGLPTLNIRPRDRFALDGLFYEVVSVHPQRQIGTVAQARLAQ